MPNGRPLGARRQTGAIKFLSRSFKLVMKLEKIRTFLLIILLSSLITATLISSSAAENSSELTATTLISLYKGARIDLLNTLNAYFNVSTASSGGNASINANASGSSNETVSGSGVEVSANAAVSINANASGSSMAVNASFCTNIYETTLGYVKQADQYIEAAEANIKAGNYNIAAHQALKSLNILGKAYVHLTHCIEMQKQSASSSLGNATGLANGHVAAGLMSAILRHEMRLSRLRAVLQAANSSGVNVSSAWNLVSQAQDLLSKAKDLVTEGNSSASNIMAEANRITAQIVRTLKAGSIEAIEHGKWRVRGNRSIMNINMSKSYAHHGQNHSKNATWKGNYTSGAKGEEKGHKGKPALKPTFTAGGNQSNQSKGKGKNRMNGSTWENGNGERHRRFNGNNSFAP